MTAGDRRLPRESFNDGKLCELSLVSPGKDWHTDTVAFCIIKRRGEPSKDALGINSEQKLAGSSLKRRFNPRLSQGL
ncbi:unnamed protein product [Lasius platythorax]|uniref:Uncharacterized protein n=1 Tax=Lasius platythorax TaxID=488582 RepID=A0AAV2NRL5_9HYME